ncbi:DUF4350 domain-containing protein [Chitinophaga sp. MM2321]|uniref:DUF4350 domain-containing protein n=1 Tax=Chitinophaga sp. MM2321 TaxID=3137178 RepID=UPI0032D5A570
MKARTIYIIASIGLLLVILILFSGNRKKEDQSTDMSKATFSSKDKKAGGAYVAFKLLPELFSAQSVQVVTKPFATTYAKEKELLNTDNAYIVVANELFTTEKDIESMLYYVARGNTLFLAVNSPDPLLGKSLQFTVVDGQNLQPKTTTAVQRYTDEGVPVDTAFSYKGMISGSYFSHIDSSFTRVLGTNYKGKPNFICISHADGFIYILLNPYTFSNYFLLQENNVAALETQLSYLPVDASNLYWDDFYNNQHSAQSGDFSEWQVLMRYPAMRWALWLAAGLLLLYVIFESKRRQRIIPDRPPLANTSLEFVDAIGQLYYQQHNNANLAHKMILHLLEYIRTRFYINTNQLNEQFIEALSKKAAMPETEIRELLQMIYHIQLEANVSDEYLQEFYKRIQLFYLNTK